ncbi:NME9 [Cordylochernes scorpioides]|uniref:NME9 n=1 Tax=Cordylochernes scorpioides TaxID=51811 RepID=A0ABY6KIU8_9ARAC|nr:NME9 [Cordylochernes scorpioides]
MEAQENDDVDEGQLEGTANEELEEEASIKESMVKSSVFGEFLASQPMEKLLAIIKPDALPTRDAIKEVIEAAGFVVLNLCRIILTREQAEQFYEEHRAKRYFPHIVSHLCSDFIIVMVLWRKEAISLFRTLMGPSNPEEARNTSPDSIRARFGISRIKNAIHGSQDEEHAAKEIDFFYTEVEKPRRVEKTLAIIKPDIIQHSREIEQIIRSEGFTILQRHKLKLSEDQARDFYSDQRQDPHYEELIGFMLTGPIEVLILERKDAVKHWQRIVQATDTLISRDPSPYNIRSLFSTEKARLALHASESLEVAAEEIKFFFASETALMEKTLLIIKPDAFKKAKEIEAKVISEGFVIIDKVIDTLPRKKARVLCRDHKDKPYYRAMVTQLCSGPVMVLLLEKRQAIEHLVFLSGPWDPEIAREKAPWTLRAIYGDLVYINAIHIPETLEQATKEITLLFPAGLVDYIEIPIILEQALVLVKPSAFDKREEIIDAFRGESLAILNRSTFKLTRVEAELFCEGEKDEPLMCHPEEFLGGCLEVFVVGGANALDSSLKIAKQWCSDVTHVSPSEKRALFEKKFFFPGMFTEANVQNFQTLEYLSLAFTPILQRGLTDTTVKLPAQPASFLSDYLLRENPSCVRTVQEDCKT